MIPGNSVFPKSPTPFSSVWYDPADVSIVFCGVPITIERNFAKLAKLSYIGLSLPRHKKRDPEKEKRDLIRKSQAALDEPGRHEAIKVLFSPRTLDVYLRGKDGSLVQAQILPSDNRDLVNRLKPTTNEQEDK